MRQKLSLLAGAALLCLAWAPASAQNVVNTPNGTTTVIVQDGCQNGSSLTVPCSPNVPMPTAGGSSVGTQVGNSATGTTGATSATLPATSNKTTYICSFVISSGGTTSALVGNATITGTVLGTLNYTYVDVSSGQGLLGIAFPQCIAASAPNTTIVVTSPAGGAGTTVAVTATGFQL